MQPTPVRFNYGSVALMLALDADCALTISCSQALMRDDASPSGHHVFCFRKKSLKHLVFHCFSLKHKINGFPYFLMDLKNKDPQDKI